MKKTKKSGIIILLLFAMVMQMIIPNMGLAYADDDVIVFSGEGSGGGSTTPPAIVPPTAEYLKVTVEKKLGTNSYENIVNLLPDYRPVNGEELRLRFDIKLPPFHDFEEGSTLTYPLPEIFTTLGVTTTGKLGSVGDYEIDSSGNLIITFNDAIRSDSGGVELTNGLFYINAKFDVTDTNLKRTIELPGQVDIELFFKPVGGSPVKKSGTADFENASGVGQSSDGINWVVDINTSLDELIGAKFEDALTGNHTYAADSLHIFELEMDGTGNAAEKLPEIDLSTLSPLPSSYAGTKSLTFGFPNTAEPKAYRVKYRTIIDKEAENSSTSTYKNNIVLKNNGTDLPAVIITKTVKWGDPIAKDYINADSFASSVDWTIRYNENRKTITGGLSGEAWVEDRITSGNHIIKPGTIKVYKENETTELTVDSDYKLEIYDNKHFKVTFLNNVNTSYKIKYTSIPDGITTKGDTLTNNVTRGAYTGSAVGRSFSYENPAINKTITGIDYNDKTIAWSVSVNRAGLAYRYDMEDVIITDEFGEYLELTGSEPVVKVGNIELVKGIDYDYTTTTSGSSIVGFKIELRKDSAANSIIKPLKNNLVITFKTKYEIEDVGGNDRIFSNLAKIDWKTGAANYHSESEAKTTLEPKQSSSGLKTGRYDYKEKKFEWTVLINFNKNKLTSAEFKDKLLPEDQEVDKDSIVVRKVNKLNADGTYSESNLSAPITGLTIIQDENNKNEFSINLGSIEDPYVITYSSKVKDGFYPNTSGNYKATNEAKLLNGGSENSKWTATVAVAYTNNKIIKSGSGVTNSSMINWNFKLNYGQSELNSVEITDIVGKDVNLKPNHFILTDDSFKIYEVELTSSLDPLKPNENKILLTKISLTAEEEQADKDNKTKTLKFKDRYDNISTVVVDNINGQFTLKFKDKIEKAYYIEYMTKFLGTSSQPIENNATLSYFTTSTIDEPISTVSVSHSFGSEGSTEKFKIKLIKEDDIVGSIKLQGAKFALYVVPNPAKPTEEFYLDEGVTDANGEIEFPYSLGAGNYRLYEREAPEKYVLVTAATNIDLKSATAPSGTYTATIKNTILKGSLEITKKDSSGSKPPLGGATITVYNRADGTPVGTGKITNSTTGKVTFTGLPYGDYYYKETQAPAGYVKDDTEYNFEIRTNNQKIERVLENDKIKGNFKLIKQDKENTEKKISGVGISVYKVGDDTTPVRTGVTSASGEVTFTDLPYGNYYYRETSTPEGYIPNTTIKYPFTIETNGATVSVTLDNEILKGDIVFTKQNESGNPLGGAIFGLYPKDETTFDSSHIIKHSLPSDSINGEVKFENIPYGEYKIRETSAPTGYYPSDKVLSANVITNGATVTAKSGSEDFVKNEKIKGDLVVKKVDKDNNLIPLKGAKFELEKGGVVIATGVETDEFGLIVFKDLEYGNDYILREIEAPKDYRLSSRGNVSVFIEKNGVPVEETFENEKMKGSIEITKIDGDTKKPLSGAEISVYRKDGTLEGTKTTGADGKVKFDNLPIGEYYYKEAKAPIGYNLNDEEYSFKIESDNQELFENLSNKEIIYIPNPEPPTTPPTTNPTTEPEPKNPEPTPEPKPEVPTIKETTDPEKPVDVTPPNIPENGKKEIVEPPKNGKVEFTEDGKWTYTPNPGFVGKDKFTVKVINEDGEEEEFIIEVDVIPGGPVVLPETGEESPLLLYVLGFMSIASGITMLFKKRKKEEDEEA